MINNNTNEVFDVVIIGAGPAGMTAGIYAVRANLKTVMLEKGAPGGKMLNTHEVENWPGLGNISGMDLSMKMYEHAIGLGVPHAYGEVVAIRDKGDFKEVETADGVVRTTKSVIIASGTKPRGTGAKGEEEFNGKGISWCAICDGAFFRDKEVLVVGGGNSAVEEAVFLSKTVKKITLVNILPTLQADAKAIDLAKATGKMDFLLGYSVESFNGSKFLESVTLKNVETNEIIEKEVEGAFVFIGHIPETSMLDGLNITNKWGYIETNERMETKVKGIYAVGDVINKELRQITTACSDGSIAAVNATHYVEELNNKLDK